MDPNPIFSARKVTALGGDGMQRYMNIN